MTKEKRATLRFFLIVAVSFLFAVLILTGYLVFECAKGSDGSAYYFKDSVFYAADLATKQKTELTDILFDGTDTEETIDYSLFAFQMKHSVLLSNDLLFFPAIIHKGGIEYGDYYPLYYRELHSTESNPTKVDLHICDYKVSEDAAYVFYRKLPDSALYRYCIKTDERELISSTAIEYRPSTDGKRAVFLDRESDLFFWEEGAHPVLLDSTLQIVLDVSDDRRTVWYLKDNSIYTATVGAAPQTIAENISLRNYDAFATGEAYYGIAEKPTDFPHTLYYYDGKSASPISQSLSAVESWAYDTAVLIYGEQTDSGVKYYLFAGGNKTALQFDEGSEFHLSLDGSFAYCVTPKGELFRIAIENGKAMPPVLLDTGVDPELTYIEDDMIVYLKDAKACTTDLYRGCFTGDLFIDGTKIDSNAAIFADICRLDDGTIVYFTDWNEETNRGTLSAYDGQPSELAACVESFTLAPNGTLLFLADYNDETQKGDLYAFDGARIKKIDSDVQAIVEIEVARPTVPSE